MFAGSGKLQTDGGGGRGCKKLKKKGPAIKHGITGGAGGHTCGENPDMERQEPAKVTTRSGGVGGANQKKRKKKRAFSLERNKTFQLLKENAQTKWISGEFGVGSTKGEGTLQEKTAEQRKRGGRKNQGSRKSKRNRFEAT